MMKKYSNPGRKPMMTGGMAMKPKKRVKKAMGDEVNAPTPKPTTEKASGMSNEERQKLIKRKAQLQAALDKGGYSDEVMKEMRMTIMQIDSQLGQSATKGRNPVDAPEGMMYGGKATPKKKLAMGGKPMAKNPKTGEMMPTYAMDGKGKMMYGGKAKKK